MERLNLSLVAILLLVACGNEAPERASVVDPAFGEPCRYVDCSNHGQCMATADSTPRCLCEVGYGGTDCEGCEKGFHRDSKERCAPDRLCAEQPTNPCGVYGSCTDGDGVIACSCDPGYEGPRCNLCQNGYGRDSFGECLQLVITEGGMTTPLPPKPVVSCSVEACNDNGECSEANSMVQCTCDSGYAGSRCGACAPSFRRDAADRCVPAESCKTDSCNAHGTCSDDTGSILCTCSEGYGQPRCAGCAAGYHQAGDQGCVVDLECLASTCAGQGTCTKTGTTLTCACNTGYGGPRCDTCSPGYHLNAASACVLDEACTANQCGAHGTCGVSGGIASCTCEAGYSGSTCSTCATGYIRDALQNTCVPYACSDNPIRGSGRLDFENRTTFPEYENNCVSGLSLDTADIKLTSIAADGVVWACARNTLYGLSSNHVFLEAGSLGPAQLLFSGPISQLSFEYGARTALALEVLADRRSVGTLTAARRTHGPLTFTFDPPATLIELRSSNGSTNLIGLDNIEYAPPSCQ